jgi:UDP-glucose 4-epimerase
MQEIKKTLLIGGAGFIGEQMVPFLKAAGRDISIVGRSDLKKPYLIESANYYQGDFGSLDFIRPLVESHDEVVLLAYASAPNTSFKNPLDDLHDNLTPSVRLFIETAKQGKKLLLVSSGGTIYGEQKHGKIIESHGKRPISPYGLTKLTLENYAFLYGVTHNLNFVVVRPTNAYGVGQIPFTGQGFIATAVASAKLNKPIKIFGESGTIRDYLYVTDLAEGIVDVLTKGESKTAYNISSGVGFSNLEIVNKLDAILKKQGASLELEHLPERPFDVKSNILDNHKINKHTGWQPRIAIDEGLALVVADVFKA